MQYVYNRTCYKQCPPQTIPNGTNTCIAIDPPLLLELVKNLLIIAGFFFFLVYLLCCFKGCKCLIEGVQRLHFMDIRYIYIFFCSSIYKYIYVLIDWCTCSIHVGIFVLLIRKILFSEKEKDILFLMRRMKTKAKKWRFHYAGNIAKSEFFSVGCYN